MPQALEVKYLVIRIHAAGAVEFMAAIDNALVRIDSKTYIDIASLGANCKIVMQQSIGGDWYVVPPLTANQPLPPLPGVPALPPLPL